jgi:hypothetical protein
MAIKHHASKKALFDIMPPPQLFPVTPIHSYSYKKLTDSTDSIFSRKVTTISVAKPRKRGVFNFWTV